MLTAVLPVFFQLGRRSSVGRVPTRQSLCQKAYSEYRAMVDTTLRKLMSPSNLANSVDDYCVFAPPDPGPNSVMGNTEVSHTSSFFTRMQLGYGTRFILDGAITSAHF